MRIIIADDEYLVRMTLVSMIQEMPHPFEICGQAESGEELLDLLPDCRPDIVLLDLRMPEMGGLEAMRIGKDQSPMTHWIILTGFSDFDSARESVKLGASDYLLKPSSAKELEQALLRVAKMVQEQRNLLQKQFESNLNAAFSGWIDPALARKDTFMDRAHYTGVSFAIDIGMEERAESFHQQFFSQLRLEMEADVSESFYPALFMLPNGEMAFIGAWLPEREEEGSRVLRRLLRKLEADVQARSGKQAAVTLFSTGVCLSLQELRLELNECSRAAPLRVTKGIGRHWSKEQLVGQHPEWLMELGQLWLDLSEAYKAHHYLAYMKTVDRLRQHFITEGLHSLPQPVAQPIEEYACVALNRRISLQGDEWVRTLYEIGESVLQHHASKDSGSRMIEQVISYLEQHYACEITLAELARDFRVTPNYLSTLFHQTTGTTFVKYVTRLRMMQAKQLLADQALQVQQVAEKVGYYSTRHFTKCFFEFEGCSPSEYKKKRKLQDLH
ncbi:helix-turn-helix domain-containing protein [Paenibacillus sp. MER TA 81-3]|uniref:helix-turn-helix domain-containing protein n=1 Tax=Paenibacillus sp. MER TA 81-3 TaxID=2939573 RepID=UPI0020408709|nr:helix-turn-helix domain-containing protein [Paenibacillus sp. MER TA 81-3]MCM3341306.1 helix-turn-helix domain-containing protein [Paenibacillus sp. MER TA 81-3]